MEYKGSTQVAEAVIQILKTRGWFISDTNQIKALTIIHTALSDDDADSSIADSVESELLNTDLKSIGAKSLPEPNLSKISHLHGPKILQISSVRDISVSSTDGFSDSNNRRLLKLVLTDGHNEITAVEYGHIPFIPNDVVPGAKVRLENKVPVHSGIVCLNPQIVTLLGGVVQSLHDEWEMNKKYSGLSRSLMRLTQETGGGGPPPFEKLQIGALFHRSSQQGKPAVAQSGNVQSQSTAEKQWNLNHSNQYSAVQKHRGKDKKEEPQVLTLDKKIDYPESSRSSVPATMETAGNTEIRQINIQHHADDFDDKMTTAVTGSIEQKPSNSDMRPKEVAESVRVQNQAAAQKLLQKMSSPNQGDRHSRGCKYKGKGKQEEQQSLTLDEWEQRKAGRKPSMKNHLPDTSRDENLAWKLQNQLDMEDSHVQVGMHSSVAVDIRMSLFSHEKDGDRVHGAECREGWEKGRGRGRGKGRGSGKRQRGRH